MESQEERNIVETGTELPKAVEIYVIELDLSNGSVMFEDILGDTKQLVNDIQSEMDAMVDTTGDDQTRNGFRAGVNRDELSYYPDLRSNERRTACIPPERLGYETAHIATELINDIEIPVNYEKGVSRKDSSSWRTDKKLEMELSNKFNSWKLVQLPPGRIVV